MLYIISNCTNGKKIIPHEMLLFRNYTQDTLKNLCSKWEQNLNSIKTEKLIAKDLYKGVSWKAVKDTESKFQMKYKTSLLVASAGYGLINSNTPIVSYGITYAKNQSDSVSKYFKNKDWWETINRYDISQFKDASIILICLSKEYLDAMSNYLQRLIDLHGEKVFIINTSHTFTESLKNNILTFDKRFNEYEPGTLLNLSQRCMRWLSKEIIEHNLPFNHTILQKHINTFLEQFQFKLATKGQRMNDKELIGFIEKQLLAESFNTAFLGLKALRKNGYSCEQKRYQKFFHELKSLHGK